MAGDEEDGDITTGDLVAQPVEAIEKFIAGRILEHPDDHIPVDTARLAFQGGTEILRVLGGIFEV